MSRAKDIEAIVVYLRRHTSPKLASITIWHNGGEDGVRFYKIKRTGMPLFRKYLINIPHVNGMLECDSWSILLMYIAIDLLDNWPSFAREIVEKVKVE